ncbi:MAG TPA: VOC family protein [Ktedonosporobacter sp.]|jgi:catechol 2,3-dioxygenase-like lactoylglutathione lyase family enzyme|nr:VOC family protein [Ktedonosporobacter sp.]
MLTALDHIIIGVRDLAQATNTFDQKLGLAVSGGGIHPSGGTANRIIVIGDTYIELIAVRAPDEAQQSMLARLAKGEGYLNFVLASNDIYADSAAIVARGNTLLGPKAGELRSADGRSRAWTRADIERPDLTQHYPFIIQHDSVGEERRRRLAGWTTPPSHPLGATKILGTTIAVENLDEATQRFQRIYGLQPSKQFSGESEGWSARLISFRLNESGQSFELATPAGSNDATETTASGALTQHLQQFGESLYRMTIAVENLAIARRYLDEHSIKYTCNEPCSILWIDPHEANGAVIALREEKNF